MQEYLYELKVPKERIAVLIGKNGEIKKNIEAATKTRVDIDSKEGDVFLKGDEPISLYVARDVIRAISRGFNPDIAMLLLKQDYVFELIDLKDYVKNKKQMPRLKGRVIGKEGKSRRNIETLTETYICVYGKTIGIIGMIENATLAKRAVCALLGGSPHATVYKWLEKQRKELKT